MVLQHIDCEVVSIHILLNIIREVLHCEHHKSVKGKNDHLDCLPPCAPVLCIPLAAVSMQCGFMQGSPMADWDPHLVEAQVIYLFPQCPQDAAYREVGSRARLKVSYCLSLAREAQ